MSIFSDILLLSKQMEYERVHRELNEVLQDEFVIDAKMQGELVKECRLEKAIMLLASTEDTIEEIAHRVGYRNSTPIYQGIRQKFGMSPTEYRNSRYK